MSISTEGSIEAIKRCVAYGLGIAFLPLMAVESELEKGSLVRIPIYTSPFNLYTIVKNGCHNQ